MSRKERKSFCSIYESRTATLVSESEKIRLARFLKPCAETINQFASFPFQTLSFSDQIVSQKPQSKEEEEEKHLHLHLHPKQLHFNPHTKWGDWFESITAKHAFAWNQAGIFDALLSSLYEIPPNPCLILGLVEYWCPNTNTFVFPWGEATMTLEDVMILGGFSVLGTPVTLPLSDDMLSIEAKLVELERRMSKKQPHQQISWIELFFNEEVDNSHDELEHVGFLSLWLSRFVFPPLREMSRVFPIAIHLSKGTRIALAPAVLATIYHNLCLPKEEKLVSSSVMGPFQLLQIWAFERFPILVGPNKELKLGEPRVARWHKLNSDAASLSALKSAENFKWRPYVDDLKNWCFVSHYKDNGQLVVDGLSSAEELRSFGLCLCADELVGLDCIVEKYMPYRVAMQFGMDQHMPGEFAVMRPSCKRNFSFYVPAKCHKPYVSLEYYNWWKKKSKVSQGKTILKPERKVPDSNLLDVLMIAKQYSEEEEESIASTASTARSSKGKSSTKDKEVKSNSRIAGKDLVVQEGESETKRRRALKEKNEPSFFSAGFNNAIGHSKGKGKQQQQQQHSTGTYDNPLDVEDYA